MNVHSQENTCLRHFSSRGTKWANSKAVFLVRASGTVTIYLQERALFCFFWGRKQQAQHILCCDTLFYWRQERFQIFKARLLLEVLNKDEWLELLVLSHVGGVYQALYLSALISGCKKRSCCIVFIPTLFSWKLFLCHLSFLQWEWHHLIWTLWWAGFPPPQNSAIHTFIKKAESQISLLSFGVYFFKID